MLRAPQGKSRLRVSQPPCVSRPACSCQSSPPRRCASTPFYDTDSFKRWAASLDARQPNAQLRNLAVNCHVCSLDIVGFRDWVIVLASTLVSSLIVEGAERNGKVGCTEWAAYSGKNHVKREFMSRLRDRWYSGKEGAEYAGFSRDWLEQRAVAWPLDNQPVQGKVRYKLVDGVRRYWKADIDAFFVLPREYKGPVRLVPKLRAAA